MTANDWSKAPRLQNGTSWFYFATEQYRSDCIDLADRVSKLAKPRYRHPGDYNVLAARLGWLPSYPTFNKGSQELINDARAAGAGTEAEINQYVAQALKNKDLQFCVEDPAAKENHPRNLFVWRANLIGSSSKGHEYFLKHLLGTKNAVLKMMMHLHVQKKSNGVKLMGQVNSTFSSTSISAGIYRLVL